MYKKGSLGKEAGGDEKFGRGLNKLGEISERNEVSLIFKAYVFLDFGTFRTQVQMVDTTFTHHSTTTLLQIIISPFFFFTPPSAPPNAQSMAFFIHHV